MKGSKKGWSKVYFHSARFLSRRFFFVKFSQFFKGCEGFLLLPLGLTMTHGFSIGFGSGFCDGHSKTRTAFPSSQFFTILAAWSRWKIQVTDSGRGGILAVCKLLTAIFLVTGFETGVIPGHDFRCQRWESVLCLSLSIWHLTFAST